MNVIASKGLKVPMEDKPNTYIDDENSVVVEDSAYYARRVADGDLLVVKDSKKAGDK